MHLKLTYGNIFQQKLYHESFGCALDAYKEQHNVIVQQASQNLNKNE